MQSYQCWDATASHIVFVCTYVLVLVSIRESRERRTERGQERSSVCVLSETKKLNFSHYGWPYWCIPDRLQTGHAAQINQWLHYKPSTLQSGCAAQQIAALCNFKLNGSYSHNTGLSYESTANHAICSFWVPNSPYVKKLSRQIPKLLFTNTRL